MIIISVYFYHQFAIPTVYLLIYFYLYIGFSNTNLLKIYDITNILIRVCMEVKWP